MDFILAIFRAIGAIFKAFIWALGALLDAIVWTIHAVHFTYDWLVTYGPSLLVGAVALAVASAIVRAIPWPEIGEVLASYWVSRKPPPGTGESGWRAISPWPAPPESGPVAAQGLSTLARAGGGRESDPVKHALNVLNAWLDESALPSTHSMVLAEKWTGHRLRPATCTRFAIDAFRTVTTIPHVVLSQVVNPAVKTAACRLASSPTDGRLMRKLVDEITGGTVTLKERSTLCITVVRLRGLDEKARASSAAVVQLTFQREQAQEPVVILLDAQPEDGESDDQQAAARSASASLARLGPIPSPQGQASEVIDTRSWATYVSAHDRQLADLFHVERSRWTRPGWPRFLSSSQPHPATASRKPRSAVSLPSMETDQVATSAVTGRASNTALRRSRPLPPGYARVIAGVHGHKELSQTGIGVLYLPGTCPAKVNVSSSSNVTVADHCRIRDTAHFHVRRVTLDWGGLQAAEMRSALRRLGPHPDRGAVRAVQVAASRLTARTEAQAAHTTSTTVQGDAEITIHGADAVNFKDYATIAINRHYTIDESTISVLHLLAADSTLVEKLGAAIADPAKTDALIRHAAVCGRTASGTELLAGAEGLAESPALVSCLFGRVDITRADNVTIGIDNRTIYRDHAGVTWAAGVDTSTPKARKLATRLNLDFDDQTRVAGEPTRPATRFDHNRNRPGPPGPGGPSMGR